ncbi:glycosyltransferase [Pengzhenrongella sicca]|uniref:Glycosyltransferase n=1 Tax=Pengzhenrongella sicca TaxID=2819238 RepID=A0A8A4ZAM1_9MICO|nr:glycosyltransferase [Pengzhenrongella sicca]QTE29020.1 glycosyltransferase [Pengzhenrongella sicca]
MHLVIVTAFDYPDGGPVAARHLALTAGLAQEGHRVSFVMLHQARPPAGARSNPAITWTSIARAGSTSPLAWRLTALRRLDRSIGSAAATGAVDAVLAAVRDPLLLEATLRAARRRGIPVLHELLEYPDVVRPPGPLGRVQEQVFVRRHLPAFDGVLVISGALEEYAARSGVARTALLGSIVDTALETPLDPLKLTTTFTVGYAGSLVQEKDGVLTLLRAAAAAAARLAPRYELRLEILGDTRPAAGLTATRESHRLGLDGRATFHGLVPHDQVRGILARCHLLALPRPVSRQASGGFPTKLGEYLATARPVLTTAVGEIPRHLRDGETCLMVAPNDEGALARALVGAASSYDAAREVGRRGRGLIDASFSAPVQARKVVGLVESLRGARP